MSSLDRQRPDIVGLERARHYDNFLACGISPWRRPRSSPDKSTIRFELAYDGGVWDAYVNGEKVVEGRIQPTQPMIFSADETANVGIDLATLVVEFEANSRLTARIPKVTIEVHAANPTADAAVVEAQKEVARRTR